jgi:hypothetical protein
MPLKGWLCLSALAASNSQTLWSIVTFAHRMNAADLSHFSATNDYRNTTKI